MGKIVKYCKSCDESFAEKFGFCPNCGKSMQAFEMNPVGEMVSVSEKRDGNGASGASDFKTETVVPETTAKTEPLKVPETVAAVSSVATASDKTRIAAAPVSSEATTTSDIPQTPVKETKTFAAAASANGNNKSQVSSDGYRTVESQKFANADNGGFNVTVIEEKNSKQRNLLLLASLFLMVAVASGGLLASLFNYNVSVAAIGDESGLSVPITDEVPIEVEDVPKPKLEKTAGGGGGGGGRKDETPVSKGDLPPQFKDKPIITPSKEDISVSNPAIRVMRATQGPDDIIPKKRSATNGDPNSTNTDPSNGYSLAGTGMGENGKDGIGNNGESGYGANGKGGRGISTGNKYGNENGDGGRVASAPPPPAAPPPAPPKKPAVTEKYKIISKPRANYTDVARQNNFTGGTVTVKVTLLASGQVGSVTPVSGLPYGLTEQAIAAAKSIKFEPAKRDGVPYTVVVPVQYSFTLY